MISSKSLFYVSGHLELYRNLTAKDQEANKKFFQSVLYNPSRARASVVTQEHNARCQQVSDQSLFFDKFSTEALISYSYNVRFPVYYCKRLVFEPT